MPEVQTIRLKKEKRFTRENDEDYDLLCKCFHSVFGMNNDGECYIDLECDADNMDGDHADLLLRYLIKIKFKQKGVTL